MEFSDPSIHYTHSNDSNSTGIEMDLANTTYQNSDISILQDNNEETIKQAAKILRNVCIPCISLVGLVGNTLSLLVFCARSMKHSSSSMFLASLAFVDNLFLLDLLLIWVDGEFYNILRNPLACEAIMFVSYVTGFLSVWFIVGFTTERFIAICFPLRSQMLCSMFREKMMVLVLIITAFLLYNHNFWTIRTVKLGPRYRCVIKPEMVDFLQVITWVDTIITMVVPFVLITFMNIRVLIAAADCHRKTQACCRPAQNSNSETVRYTGTTKSLRIKSQMRVTRTLILVSTTFLVLNLPSHVLRLHNLIIAIIHSEKFFEVSIELNFVQEIANFLYYSTFSCNFILYSVFGRHFQKNLKAILRCRSTMTEEKDKLIRRISSLRNTTTTTTSV